jgi:hypothetical protein
MFRKSKIATQLNIFTNNHSNLHGKALNIFQDVKEWHNLFRTQIFEHIDEDLFRPLYCDDNGAPNSSIRVLLGMMILKEAHGISDSLLFDNCMFHSLFRSALGLYNIDDPVPVASTYYLFRKNIVEWERAGNGNLFDKLFSQLTKSQITEFSINGAKIRMDSKLLGSNIAKLSRYEIVHETLRLAIKSLKISLDSFLSASEIEALQEVTTESCSNVSYRSSTTQLEAKMVQLGIIIFKLLNYLESNNTEPINLLREVFYQQYEVVDSEVVVLPKEKLHFDRIESPHDTDCRFRKKGDQKQRGYQVNVTETCSKDNDINLITSVIVEPASVSDNSFLIPAIDKTLEITSQNIETLNSDGAYHSVANHEYCSDKEIDFIIGALGSSPSRLDHSVDDEGNLICIDTQTGEQLKTRKVKTKSENAPRKWLVECPWLSEPRRITQHDVEICSLRKQIASRSKEELNVRNNVEATIFQLCYHYRSNKSRYRGIEEHRIWANTRCIWVNFVRIIKHTRSFDPILENGNKICIQVVENSLHSLKKIGLITILAVKNIFTQFYLFPSTNFA